MGGSMVLAQVEEIKHKTTIMSLIAIKILTNTVKWVIQHSSHCIAAQEKKRLFHVLWAGLIPSCLNNAGCNTRIIRFQSRLSLLYLWYVPPDFGGKNESDAGWSPDPYVLTIGVWLARLH